MKRLISWMALLSMLCLCVLPGAAAETYALAASSFQGNYAVGDLLTGGDLAVRVSGDFEVRTYSGSAYLQKDDTRIRVFALDTEDLGWIGTGVGLLGRFMNTNDLAIKGFAATEFGFSVDDGDLTYPSIRSGAETAMIKARSAEYNGAQNMVCMAMLHEDSTFFCMIGSSPSGTPEEMERLMLLALDCIEIVR